jgi:hypothetical protein
MKSVLTFLFAMFLMGAIWGQAPTPANNDLLVSSTIVGINNIVILELNPTTNIEVNPSQGYSDPSSSSLPSGVTLASNTVTQDKITAILTIPSGLSSGTITLRIRYKLENENGAPKEINLTYFITAGTVTVLAVELVDFKAKLSNQRVSLNWLTAKEENINFFSVERSKNGQNFVEIARIKTGNAKKDYAFVDEKPYDGNSYYRLKVTENYGSKIQYSPVVTIAAQSKGLLKAYPSVAYNELIVELPEGNRETTLNIVDMTGKVIMIQKTSSLQLPIDVSSLIAGHYLIVAQNDLGKYVEKFMKQE